MLPRHHDHPFDRGLIAHALRDDLLARTHAAEFADDGVRVAER